MQFIDTIYTSLRAAHICHSRAQKRFLELHILCRSEA